MTVSPCSPPRPALRQHSLNALRLYRRNPQSLGGLCKTWERCFDCDLTAHLPSTVDRYDRNCNAILAGIHSTARTANVKLVLTSYFWLKW